MKLLIKFRNFLVISCLMLWLPCKAQIVAEAVYDSVTFGNTQDDPLFYPIKLSENEIKYAAIRYNTIKLYNLDHTLFETINIPLDSLIENHHVGFISRNLFDTDSTTIEYLVEGSDSLGNYGVYVFSDVGTQLFFQSHYHIYTNYFVAGYPIFFKNVINTPQGAKLLLVNGLGKVKIWSLPGSYIEWQGLEDFPDAEQIELGDPLPNPSTSVFKIPMHIPVNAINPKIRIYTLDGKLISENSIIPGQQEFIVDSANMNQGTYMVTVYSENGKSISKKIVLTKKSQ